MQGQEAYKILYDDFNFISMPTVMIRKSLLETHKLEFNNRLNYLIDWDLWIILAQFSDFYFIKQPLLLYRNHEENEYKMMDENIYYHELMLIKLSLLASNQVNGHFGVAVAQVAASVKKQHHKIFGSSPSALGVVKKMVLRHVPVELKNRVKQLIRG